MIVESGAPSDLEKPTSGMSEWGVWVHNAPNIVKFGQKAAVLQESWPLYVP